jgi:dipeptidyl aminopeptidase/acylaminoacyl peptidase
VLGRNYFGLETDSGSTVGGRHPSALSADGSTVWFSTFKDPFSPAPVPPQLYVRSDALDPAAATTTQVSRSQAADSLGDDCATEAVFLAASEDGASAWFTCASRLTDDAPAGGGIYRYDRAGGALRFVAPALDGSEVGGQMTLFGADRDADHVWFSTASQLTADAPAGSAGLYLLHDDAVTFVAPLAWPDAITAASISPDGARIAFVTDDQLDPAAGGFGQVYVVDADAAGSGPVCIACHGDGSPALGRSDLGNGGADTFLDANNVRQRGNVTADGTVYFASADRLVDADENETVDVYQYRDGELSLLSSGRDERPSVFGGASADGRDVFILTSQRLVAQDTDNGSADVYAVRVDGGFAPTTPPPVCGEDCQGPPPPKLAPPAPATATFRGPGDERDRSAPPATSKLTVTAPSARQRTRWARTGRLTLAVRATHAGVVRVRVSGRVRARTVTVAAASRRLARGGSARLTLRLSSAARAQLARRGTLRLRIVVIHSQVANPRRVTLTLRAPAATPRNGGRR